MLGAYQHPCYRQLFELGGTPSTWPAAAVPAGMTMLVRGVTPDAAPLVSAAAGDDSDDVICLSGTNAPAPAPAQQAPRPVPQPVAPSSYTPPSAPAVAAAPNPVRPLCPCSMCYLCPLFFLFFYNTHSR